MAVSTDANKALEVLASIRGQLSKTSPGGTDNLEADIGKLERVLKDPVFQQNLSVQEELHRHPEIIEPPEECPEEIVEPSTSQAPPTCVPTVGVNQQLVAELKERFRRRLVAEKEPGILELLKGLEPDLSGRKLKFVPIEVGRDRTETGLTTVNTRERVVVIGVSNDSSAIRHGDVTAGDELLAIDTKLTAGPTAKTCNVPAILEELVNASDNDPTTLVFTFAHNCTVLDDQGNMVLTGDWTQVQAVELTNDGSGLGFGIVGGRSTGVVVKTILPGGPADKDGRLRPGDHLLQIGTINLHGMSSQQVAMILRQQHSASVQLVVGRPVPSPAHTSDPSQGKDDTGAFSVPTKEALDVANLEQHLSRQQAAAPAPTPPSPPEPISEETETVAVHEPTPSPPPAPIDKEPSPEPVEKEEEKLEEEAQKEEVEAVQEEEKVEEEARVVEVEQNKVEQKEDSSVAVPSSDGVASTASGQVLDEIALATFCRVNWPQGQTETLEVQLERDQALGLGITVAGYVHRKEEISGVFVKNLVQGSAAERNGNILVHDLILEVNGTSLEGLSHASSVRALVNSGPKVRLKLVRFAPGSPQALCLKMLREQETETQMIDIAKQNSQQETSNELPTPSDASTPLEPTAVEPEEEEPMPPPPPPEKEPEPELTDDEVREKWREIVGDNFDLIVGRFEKHKGLVGDGSLGLCLEGTVDVVNGAELRPHHYIQKIHPDGPAAKCSCLRPGDELLEVNNLRLFGVSHVEVMRILTALADDSAIRLVVARPSQVPPTNVYLPRSEQPQASSYYSVLSPTEERMHKQTMRSRSLELLYGMAVWSITPTIIELEKGNRGLGFSVLDYQDPLHPSETVIVIKSLVPGGPAHVDGRLLPGDRLLYINDVDLTNASLDAAVQALKSSPRGKVLIGVAKPLPLHDEEPASLSSAHRHSPIISRSERLLAKSSLSSPQPKRKHMSKEAGASDPYIPQVPPGDWSAEARRRLYPQAYYPSAFESDSLHHSVTGSTLSGSYLSMFSWSPVSTPSLSPAGSPSLLRGSWGADIIHLPQSLEQTIRVRKGPDPLGVNLDPVDKAINGCQVKHVHKSGAIGKDGRVLVGDLLTKLNNENLRRVTNSQAKAILKRTNLIGTDCSVTYIPSSEATSYKERAANEQDPALQPVNRLSPNSPYFSRKEIVPSDVLSIDTEDQLSTSAALDQLTGGAMSEVSREVSVEPLSALSFTPDLAIAESVAEDLLQRALESGLSELFYSYQVPDWTQSSAPEPLPTESTHDEPSSPAEEWPPPPPLSPPSAPDSNATAGATIVTVDPDHDTPSNESLATVVEVNAEPDTAPMLEDKVQIENDLKSQVPSSLATDTPTEPAKSPLIETVSQESKKTSGSRDSSTASDGASLGTGVHHQQSGAVKSKFWGEARTVELWREPNKSFGISIVGGRVEVSQKGGLPGTGNTVSGIFIKSVLPDSPAGKSGQMNMGDRVISVNGVDLREATHEQAVEVIRNASNPVVFVVQSIHSFSPHQMISSSNTSAAESSTGTPVPSEKTPHDPPVRAVPVEPEPTPPPPEEKTSGGTVTEVTVEPVPESPSVVKTPKPESKMLNKSTENGHADPRERIEAMSAAALPWSETDSEQEDEFGYTRKKIHTKYGELKGELFFVRFRRTTDGLGLSLAGNRDRGKLSVFVVGIKADSPVNTAHNQLRIGDELLEINGSVLYGRSHLNASAIIRSIRDPIIKLVALRRADAFEEMAVRPIDSYPMSRSPSAPVSTPFYSGSLDKQEPTVSSIDEGSAGERERRVKVQKGEAGFGITLTEGTTTDNLRGIFITNISPDSPTAQEQQLRVGDQVLAVNGRSVADWSSNQVAEAMQESQEKEIELTVATHTIVPLPASPQMPPVPQPVEEKKPEKQLAVDEAELPQPQTITLVEVQVDNDATEEFEPLLPASPDPTFESLNEIQDLEPEGDIALDTEIVIESPQSEVEIELDFDAIEPPETVQLTVSIPEVEAISVDLSVPEVSISRASTPDLSVSESSPRRTSIGRTEVAPVARKKSSASSGPNPATVLIESGQETLIEIDKGGQGLGLSIVGGSDTVLSTVVIHEVYPDGAAAKDGRLKPGDQVLEVQANSLRDVTHAKAISVLRQTPSKVRLLIYRDVDLQLSLLDPTQIYNIFDIELIKKQGKGLGLSIVGRKSEPGVYVSEVVKGGAAEADGRLMQGDQILAVNSKDVTTAMQEEVAAMLKTCVGKVSISVGRWKLGSDGGKPGKPGTMLAAHATPVSFALGDSTDEERDVSSASSTVAVLPQVQVTVEEASSQEPSKGSDLSPVLEEREPLAAAAAAAAQEKPKEPEPEPVAEPAPPPEEPAPIPISISEEKQEPSTSAVEPPSPEPPKVQLLDALKEEGSDSVLIELMKVEGEQLGMGIGKRSRGILITSLQSGSVAAAKLKVGDRLMAVNGQTVTDQQSAVSYVRASGPLLVLQIARPKDDPQMNSSVREVHLDRGDQGFGFSIVGGADSVPGNLPIFIQKVQTEGVAARQGALQRGDQILAVNGVSIVGLSHRDAVEVLRNAHGRVSLTVAAGLSSSH